ncbi:putative membrane protein [Synechococcus sp. PCC 7502]|uniref:DoxX family protein n=1 Tax=Synechococcus sp. PCC 7502 TaxID=1173263 RepID=UPI00029F8169|nr:DoxX family protein [Synechococcus sp. PCC 7502]AFY74575.1 putative membrane protein [Synechococcus sp. PCC 7502]
MNYKLISRIFLAIFFIGAGILHFTASSMYVKIMPPYLPAHLELVYISGVFEILGGIGIFIPFLQIPAGYGLVALMVAVFPANINMVVNYEQIGLNFPLILLWLRLPLQGLLIYWIWWSAELGSKKHTQT